MNAPLLANARKVLAAYKARFPRRAKTIAGLESLIAGGADITSRKEFRGHVVAGGVVLNDKGKILLIHHNILQRWLPPGGHVEADDTSMLMAALREIEEETGLPSAQLVTVTGYESIPFCIEGHTIPTNPAKNEPEHTHWCFTWVFKLKSAANVNLQLDEVGQYDWADSSRIPAHLKEAFLEI